jgi:pimeloyl-ACP methyl ester carboxylesterase
MNSWRILNGDFALDEKMARDYTRDFYVRSNHPVGVAWSHIKAQEKFSDLREQLATLAVPAFFIHGDKDPLIPVEAGIATAQAVPHSKMTVIPGMGHMMFNRELEDMIARLVVKNITGNV